MSVHDKKTIEAWAAENGIKQRGVSFYVVRGDIDAAIKLLKKAVQREGITKDLHRHEYYMTKGQRRRRAKADAIKRSRKQEAENKANPFNY